MHIPDLSTLRQQLAAPSVGETPRQAAHRERAADAVGAFLGWVDQWRGRAPEGPLYRAQIQASIGLSDAQFMAHPRIRVAATRAAHLIRNWQPSWMP